MKNTIKMSLVAAVAVAGLTTTASAVDVKTSGFVSYTMEKVTGQTAVGVTASPTAVGVTAADDGKEAQHDIDVRVKFVATVNDNITATVKIDETNDDDNDNGSTNSSTLEMKVNRAFFTYKNDGLAVNFGLLTAPLTDAAQADGVTVSKKLGAVTVGAGYLYTTALGADEVAFLTVGGKAGPVAYSVAIASLLDSSDSENATEKTDGTVAVVDLKGNLTTKEVDAKTGDNSATFIHANVNAKINIVSLAFDYSSATGFKTDLVAPAKAKDDQSQMKVTVAANLGMVAVKAEYAMNGEDGGYTMIDRSDVAASNIQTGATDLHKAGDASAIRLTVAANIDPKNAVKVIYAAIQSNEKKAGKDVDGENTIKLNYKHKMSKNFSMGANYEINGEAENEELTLCAKYTF